MKRSIITTSDGSKTIQIEDWDEQYHSIHGAIQESQHVFIKTGLHHFLNLYKPINLNILEIGFGTGLNAFLTALESEKLGVKIHYEGVEAYPVLAEELSQLNYAALIAPANQALFDTLHKLSWDESHSLSSQFLIKKRNQFVGRRSKCQSAEYAFGSSVYKFLQTVVVSSLNSTPISPDSSSTIFFTISFDKSNDCKSVFSNSIHWEKSDFRVNIP